MQIIELTRGKFTTIDDSDFEEVSKFKWHFDGSYAARKIYPEGGKGRWIKMYLHRQVTGVGRGVQVDHISGDKLDNRRVNLRVCTVSENRRNVGIRKNNTSGYKGVRRYRRRWTARITVNFREIHLGVFDTAEEAAGAYNVAAKQFHGEFAHINQ